MTIRDTDALIDAGLLVSTGIQGLFGFQLIVVFNQTFKAELSAGEQRAHLVALIMVALAVALVMGPVAYHRQVHPKSVSMAHLRASSWMLTLAMLPLMIAIIIDLYLVTRVVMDSPAAARGIAGAVATVYVALWVIYPRVKRALRRGANP